MPRSPAKVGSADAQRVAKVLRALDDLQSAEISIIKLSEPISSAINSNDNNNNNTSNEINNKNNENGVRTSDVSNASLDAPTPASLEADLAHYRELFAKLRFSYVEQVTKEKFIRAIVGDPPLIVTAQENAELEAGNAAAKAALQGLKAEVAGMVAELEARARDLAARYGRVRLETAALRDLPARAAALERDIAALKAEKHRPLPTGAGGEDGEGEPREEAPEMNMPLAKTVALAEQRRDELRELDRQLEQLATQAPRKRKEMERLQAELAQLEARRVHSTAAAREAQRRREDAQGGVEDDLEAKGRWYRATEAVMERVLDVQT